jgi:FkbM family methyltransferase
MKTNQKILVASVVYRGLHGARSLLGLGDGTTVRRRGIWWALDLSEGIDLSIYLFGAFEVKTVALYSRYIRPGDTVLDIGANCGSHTLFFSKKVGPGGRVLAFEPTDFAFGKLKRNIELNAPWSSNITATQALLCREGVREVPAMIYSSWPLNGQPDLNPHHSGALKTTQGAVTKTLDDVLAEGENGRVDFMKIDVDGNEFEVIQGGRGMLERDRPRVLIELAPCCFEEKPKDFDDLVGVFAGLGYKAIDISDGNSIELNAAVIRERTGDGASINALLECR